MKWIRVRWKFFPCLSRFGPSLTLVTAEEIDFDATMATGRVLILSYVLLLIQFSTFVVSYEGEDDSSNTQSSAQLFKIEGKVAVHDERLKGGKKLVINCTGQSILIPWNSLLIQIPFPSTNILLSYWKNEIIESERLCWVIFSGTKCIKSRHISNNHLEFDYNWWTLFFEESFPRLRILWILGRKRWKEKLKLFIMNKFPHI